MKVSLNFSAFAAFLCQRGLSTTLSSFLTFETNVISLGFYVESFQDLAALWPVGLETSSSPTMTAAATTIKTMASVIGPFPGSRRDRGADRTAFVWRIRDAAIAHICFYQEPRDALEAAGLSE